MEKYLIVENQCRLYGGTYCRPKFQECKTLDDIAWVLELRLPYMKKVFKQNRMLIFDFSVYENLTPDMPDNNHEYIGCIKFTYYKSFWLKSKQKAYISKFIKGLKEKDHEKMWREEFRQ